MAQLLKKIDPPSPVLEKQPPLRPLYEHQRTALGYTLEQQHPALFMDMRLGKTLVTIRRCLLYKPRDPEDGLKVLIVAPSSALGAWETELKNENQLSYVRLSGSKTVRWMKFNQEKRWYLINKEGFLALPEIEDGKFWKWDAVILDESTFLKNPRTKISKFFLKHFKNVPHRWILTGTPNPESDLEYWNQLAFLDGGVAFNCYNYWDFRVKHFEVSRFNEYDWRPKNSTTKLIRKTVSDRCMVMKRRDVGLEKKKIYQVRTFILPLKIRKMYDQAETEFEINGETTIWNVVKYQWLRRLCGGFSPDSPVHALKMEELYYLASQELKGEPIVVWFCYNQEIEACQEYLASRRIKSRAVTGKTSLPYREMNFQDFRDGEFQVLLLQEKIAQTGLDLSVSDTAVYYSEPPGLLARQQTEDRILSLKKDSPLLYIFLQIENSVDEDIHEGLKLKAARSSLSLNNILMNKLNERRQR